MKFERTLDGDLISTKQIKFSYDGDMIDPETNKILDPNKYDFCEFSGKVFLKSGEDYEF